MGRLVGLPGKIDAHSVGLATELSPVGQNVPAHLVDGLADDGFGQHGRRWEQIVVFGQVVAIGLVE